jgi:hypothetical protein
VRTAILGLGLVLIGCPAKVVGVVDSGPSVAEVIDAGIVDAGPPMPVSMEPVVTAGLADGGTIGVTSKEPIDAPKTLTIALPTKLKDFRFRLVDWRDQVVVSDDELLGDGRTYVIALPEPLKTGRRYTLSLDAEVGAVVTAESGQTVQDWELDFVIAGDVVPEPGSAKKKPKKH